MYYDLNHRVVSVKLFNLKDCYDCVILSEDVKIGEGCCNIHIGKNCSKISIGSFNSNIFIDDDNNDIKIIDERVYGDGLLSIKTNVDGFLLKSEIVGENVVIGSG